MSIFPAVAYALAEQGMLQFFLQPLVLIQARRS
jgi:hypothetical protein